MFRLSHAAAQDGWELGQVCKKGLKGVTLNPGRKPNARNALVCKGTMTITVVAWRAYTVKARSQSIANRCCFRFIWQASSATRNE